MMHGPLPVEPGQRIPLGIGNIKPTVKGRDIGHSLSSGKRKMQVIDMKVNYVERVRQLKDLLKLQKVISHIIIAVRIQSKGPIAKRDQAAFGEGFATGKKGQLMTLSNQLFSEIRYNPFCSPIVERRDSFIKRCHRCDSHKSCFFLSALSRRFADCIPSPSSRNRATHLLRTASLRAKSVPDRLRQNVRRPLSGNFSCYAFFSMPEDLRPMASAAWHSRRSLSGKT